MNQLERRVRICRMIEKMNRSRGYSAELKLEDKSIYKTINRKETNTCGMYSE